MINFDSTEEKHFSFLDIFTEADDDDATNDQNDAGGDKADTEDDAETTDGGDADNEDPGDEEFDIDTSIDDGGNTKDGDNDTGNDTSSGNLGGSGDADSESMSDGEQAANPINTEIFDSLTPEEQQIKIKELKRLYQELYTSTDDLCKRMENINMEEDTLFIMSKVNTELHTIRDDITAYFTNVFDTKSYIENDIMFSKFLYHLNSIRDIIDELVSSKQKKLGKNGTNDDKKY